MKPFDPIRYSRCQVALMVKFSIHLLQDFPRRVRETPEDVCLMAMGVIPPSAAVLCYFDLLLTVCKCRAKQIR